MNRIKDFAYAQARLQARHAARPTAATWRRLLAIRDLAHFLQTARRTELRPWVLHLSVNASAHDMERQLREQLRRYIAEVASWQPSRWRPAVLWSARLIDLPALQHLLAEQPVLPWMGDDPAIHPFALADRSALWKTLESSGCKPLLTAWQEGESLLEGWLGHWHSLWPQAQLQPLQALVTLLREHLTALAATEESQRSEAAHAALADRLTRLFRRHTQQPVTVFLHLTLVALDLETLRGALLARQLFPEQTREAAA